MFSFLPTQPFLTQAPYIKQGRTAEKDLQNDVFISVCHQIEKKTNKAKPQHLKR